MLERYCDIIVIGTEIPGLVTAAFLARRGLSVQVIETNPYHAHSKLPDPTCLTHLNSKLLRSILGRLNVPESNIQSFLGTDESYLQVIFKKHRIDVQSQTAQYLEELDREFPEQTKWWQDFLESMSKFRHQYDLQELLNKVMPDSWSEKRQLKKFIAEQSFNDKYTLTNEDLPQTMKAFLEAQRLLSMQNLWENPYKFLIAEHFNPNDGAVFALRNGNRQLTDMLIERITHHQGTYRQKAHLQSLLYRNGIIEGITLAEEQGQILSKYVIWNDRLDNLKEYLPKKWRFRSLIKQCSQEQKPVYNWFSTRFNVPTAHIPEPLQSNTIVIGDESKPLIGSNFIYLQCDPNRHGGAESTLQAHFLLPSEALAWTPEQFEPYFDSIKSELEWLMPFSRNCLELTFPQESIVTDPNMLLPSSDDDFNIFIDSATKHPLYAVESQDVLDLFHYSYKTPAPNFYLSHPSVYANLGIESSLLLGLKITDLVWQEVEKVKKRAMKAERRIA